MEKDWVAQNSRDLLRQISRFLEAIDTPDGQAKAKLTPAQLLVLHNKQSALLDACDLRDSAEATFSASVRTQSEAHSAAASELRNLGRAAQSSESMDNPTREAAGLTIRQRTGKGNATIPVVEDLICRPRPSGENFLDWSGPTGGGITYNIECRTAAGQPWVLVGYSTRTAYLHEEAGSGVHREYRVIPQRSGRAGSPSNAATAY